MQPPNNPNGTTVNTNSTHFAHIQTRFTHKRANEERTSEKNAQLYDRNLESIMVLPVQYRQCLQIQIQTANAPQLPCDCAETFIFVEPGTKVIVAGAGSFNTSATRLRVI
jgi:hypothetical protein